MSDRLQELLQQRASIQSHLAWLDREIAIARGETLPSSSPVLATPLARPTDIAPVAQMVPVSTPSDAEAEEILAHYRQDTTSLHTDVRKGCLLYFFGALLLIGLGLVSFYFINRLIRSDSSQSPPAAQGGASVER
jgi:hypothetical protein